MSSDAIYNVVKLVPKPGKYDEVCALTPHRDRFLTSGLKPGRSSIRRLREAYRGARTQDSNLLRY